MLSTNDQYRRWKQNELSFQDHKYEQTPLDEAHNRASIDQFTQHFLTACEDGGHKRGRLMALAVERLTTHDIIGKRVLDYCCGRGDLGIFLSMQGADVYGFDMSSRAIEVARYKAKVNGVPAHFDVMDAESLEYPADYFDYVIGFEALHHVIMYPKMPAELHRVLRPDGAVIFAENWGGDNPLFQLWRSWTTLRSNQSADRGEVILSQTMLKEHLQPLFSMVEATPISLTYMAKRYVRHPKLLRACRSADGIVLRAVPALRRYCGESVITLKP
jgi:2-polyprenyl-3-methyl-5-hydroxy-6-metoxy-1,4-benzoquinol methylase